MITSYPLAPNPLIIFTRRSDSPTLGGPIPFTFHYEPTATIPTIELLLRLFFSPFRAFLFSLAPSFFFPPSFSSFSSSFSSFIHFAPLRLPSRSFSLEPRYIVHIYIYIVLATQASKRMYARCAIRFHLRPSRGGYSVSVLCPDFVRFSLRLDGACAARDWNGTSEFPRACYRMLHPAAPTGLSSSIIRTRGRSASDPSQCRAS